MEALEEVLKTHNVFITGGGGVGKSYLLNKLKEAHPELVLTSTTGISAININGQTIHSWAGIGIADKPIAATIKIIERNKKQLDNIQKTKLLAIDEISMLDNITLDYINTVLKVLRSDKRPFGGIRVILIGDFFQLPPVKIQEKDYDFCFNSNTWKELDLKTIYLKKVHRQTDKNFVDCLNRAREGNIVQSDIDLLNQRSVGYHDIPENIIHLYSLNSFADKENEDKFRILPGPIYTFKAKDKVKVYNGKQTSWYEPESPKLSKLDKLKYKQFDSSCKCPKVLNLKKDARVMLLQNINFNKGLVNGLCGYVTKLRQDLVEVLFDNGETYKVKEADFTLNQYGKPKITRTQFPLCLAYATSIHKSQGCTFDKMFVDFKGIFAHGQAYVALSRVKTLDGLFMRHFNPNVIQANPVVKEFYECIS